MVDPALFEQIGVVLREVRRAKSEAKLNMLAPVRRVVLRAPEEVLGLLELARADLVAACNISVMELEATEQALEVHVELEAIA